MDFTAREFHRNFQKRLQLKEKPCRLPSSTLSSQPRKRRGHPPTAHGTPRTSEGAKVPGSLEASLQAPESRKPQVHRAGRSPDTAIPQGDPAVGASQARGHPSPRLLRSQTPPRPHSLSLPSRVRGLGRGHPEEGDEAQQGPSSSQCCSRRRQRERASESDLCHGQKERETEFSGGGGGIFFQRAVTAVVTGGLNSVPAKSINFLPLGIRRRTVSSREQKAHF